MHWFLLASILINLYNLGSENWSVICMWDVSFVRELSIKYGYDFWRENRIIPWIVVNSMAMFLLRSFT